MIELKRIEINNGIISCDAYIEDSNEPVHIEYDKENDEVGGYKLPKGYEYCDRHIYHAICFFRKANELPEHKVIMW